MLTHRNPWYSGPVSITHTSTVQTKRMTEQSTISSVGRRWRRKPIACQFCRSRKILCSRQFPCSNCTVRGILCESVHEPQARAATSSRRKNGDGPSQREPDLLLPGQPEHGSDSGVSMDVLTWSANTQSDRVLPSTLEGISDAVGLASSIKEIEEVRDIQSIQECFAD